MEAIKKLRDKKIFNDQSIVESMIQKKNGWALPS